MNNNIKTVKLFLGLFLLFSQTINGAAAAAAADFPAVDQNQWGFGDNPELLAWVDQSYQATLDDEITKMALEYGMTKSAMKEAIQKNKLGKETHSYDFNKIMSTDTESFFRQSNEVDFLHQTIYLFFKNTDFRLNVIKKLIANLYLTNQSQNATIENLQTRVTTLETMIGAMAARGIAAASAD